jgi:hypothetical protein
VFTGKKSAQIREILISESAWEEMTCLFAPSLVYEVIGNWIWISGNTIEHKEALKEIGCKWAAKKKQWFYRPEEHKSYWNREEHTIEEIRAKYGTSGKFQAGGWQQVEGRARVEARA